LARASARNIADATLGYQELQVASGEYYYFKQKQVSNYPKLHSVKLQHCRVTSSRTDNSQQVTYCDDGEVTRGSKLTRI